MNISQPVSAKKSGLLFRSIPPEAHGRLFFRTSKTVQELSSLSPDYISVTCSAGGSGNARTPEIARLIKNCGVEPLAHLTCIHADKAAIESSLRNLHELGISNVLALRGDRIEGVKESADFRHASELIEFIRKGPYPFDIAAACYPEGHPESDSLAADIRFLKVKAEAGATHLNSQLFFDNDDFYRFERYDVRRGHPTSPYRQASCRS